MPSISWFHKVIVISIYLIRTLYCRHPHKGHVRGSTAPSGAAKARQRLAEPTAEVDLKESGTNLPRAVITIHACQKPLLPLFGGDYLLSYVF